MINIRKDGKGNLVLSVSEEDREDLARAYERGFWSALYEGLEPYSCNGSYTPFDASEGNPFVGLTGATCIAQSLDFDDDGLAEIEGPFWFDPNYMIRCPVEAMLSGQDVTFILAA